MKFIRAHGRVIPIKEKSGVKRGLALTGAAVAVNVGAKAVMVHSFIKQQHHLQKAVQFAKSARTSKFTSASRKFPELLRNLNFNGLKNGAHEETKIALKYGARGIAATKIAKVSGVVGAAGLGYAAYSAIKRRKK